VDRIELVPIPVHDVDRAKAWLTDPDGNTFALQEMMPWRTGDSFSPPSSCARPSSLPYRATDVLS